MAKIRFSTPAREAVENANTTMQLQNRPIASSHTASRPRLHASRPRLAPAAASSSSRQPVIAGGKVYLDPVQSEATAFAPATVANLGPGFDWLGCAVEVGWLASWRSAAAVVARLPSVKTTVPPSPPASAATAKALITHPLAPSKNDDTRVRATQSRPRCCLTSRVRW